MEAEPTPLAPVRRSLLSLADYVAAAQLRIPRPGTARVERTRDEVAWAIREYLVPRLDDPLAPAVAVVAGPGGAGKSAVLNAIARRHVSAVGVMRPTTSEPVVWGPRSREERAWTEFIHRLREQTGVELDVIVGDDPLTEHVIFVDTPPVDLARPDGRLPALEALGLADICIFVTSASRYADASGWMYLEAARRRGVPILHVINRLPNHPDLADDLLVDYVARLHSRGLLIEPDPMLVFPVVEGDIDPATGGPPAAAVATLRGELAELSHTEFRSAIINQTVLATTHAVARRARTVGAELAVEVQERSDFEGAVATAYGKQTDALAADLDAGRFSDLAEADVWGLAAADLTGIVTRRAGAAAQEAAQAWDERPGGQDLLAAGGEGLRRHGQDTAYDAQALLEEWYETIGDRAAAASKRGKLWARTQRRVQRQLWPQVLDPAATVARPLTRRYGTDAADLVAQARDLLATALAAALDADADRFRRFLGPAPDAEILREIETRAEWIEALVEDEAELVPIRVVADDGEGEPAVDAEDGEGEPEADADVAPPHNDELDQTESDDGGLEEPDQPEAGDSPDVVAVMPEDAGGGDAPPAGDGVAPTEPSDTTDRLTSNESDIGDDADGDKPAADEQIVDSPRDHSPSGEDAAAAAVGQDGADGESEVEPGDEIAGTAEPPLPASSVDSGETDDTDPAYEGDGPVAAGGDPSSDDTPPAEEGDDA